jgi:hypothetical protein
MLLNDRDPFSAIATLKTRFEAGSRPSNDPAGWALRWQLLHEEPAARRALNALTSGTKPQVGRPSRTWSDFVSWCLAFDWLYDHPDFPAASKREWASHLASAAETVLKEPELAYPKQVPYHNYTVRYLALISFALAAIDGMEGFSGKISDLQAKADTAVDNILDLTDLITPDGSYHESMDYMRITWAPLGLLSELRRTTTGIDPARHFTVFENFGTTYLYKLLPDGTPARNGDNEYPLLDSRDTAVLGYAVHRFKDPYAAWLLRDSGFTDKRWIVPVLQFLWDDPEVIPHNPALSTESELPRQRFFRGVGQLVMRNGWKPDSTWIEFDCGPYFSKHQHLDQNQFTIYRGGYLAIDSGADYTDTESPHYLNYYRRTVAHNSVLVYDPGERFFWSENLWPAANDGGQRMDSSRFWNTVRSREDWNRTRDLWNLGVMEKIDHQPGVYHYALGDATHAYTPSKLRRFTRELLYLPGSELVLVFDRVVSTDPLSKKAWLLHSVNRPSVEAGQRAVRFEEGGGTLTVYPLLPSERTVTIRGGPGDEFWTPGDDHGGPWGSGQNWPLEPAAGGPLPADPKLRRMWKTFWGDDFDRILPSNRKNVVPGAWRLEVSPTVAECETVFLHALTIGNRTSPANGKVQLVSGSSLAGALLDGGPLAVFVTAGRDLAAGELTLPGAPFTHMFLTGLAADSVYEINLSGPNVATQNTAPPPGTPLGTSYVRTNNKGISVWTPLENPGNVRLRLTRV